MKSPAEAADMLLPVHPDEQHWRSCRQPGCDGELVRVANELICEKCGNRTDAA